MSTRLAVAGLLIAALASARSWSAAQGQWPVSTSEYRLSPTLYFSDPAAELSSRTALHTSLEPLLRAIADADSADLVRQLKAVDQALIALQRHAAYLKVKTLEDTQDRIAKDAGSSVDADATVLQRATDARLRRVPRDQIASLGPYAKLAISRTVSHTIYLLTPRDTGER